MPGIITTLGTYSALAYLIDVPLRRALAARAARVHADQRGLPLLNVGAGTQGVRLWEQSPACLKGNSRCYPASLYGDINVDLTGFRPENGRRLTFEEHVNLGRVGRVSYADAEDLSEFPDGSVGAVLASHVLEHVMDPDRALVEWLRVVGGDREALFVITPSWWAPHAYLPPGHRWFWVDGRGGLGGATKVALR